MKAILILLISLACALASPCAAQIQLEMRLATVSPIVRLAPMQGAAFVTQTSLSPVKLAAMPISVAAPAPVSPSEPSVMAAAPAVAAVVPESVLPAANEKSLAAAIKSETPVAERSAALTHVFDGLAAAPAMPGLPGGAVEMINGAYGFYSWLAGQPGVSGSPQALANILLAALPALQKGPVIVMKDAASLTLLCADDASAPPIIIPLTDDILDKPSSPQANILVQRLEQSKDLDRSEGGVNMRVAGLMAKLAAIAAEAPAESKTEAKAPSEPLPDPLRQPRAYMERLLRDAMRESDPLEALKMLSHARQEARRHLNYQEASRFLERLLGGAQLVARQFIPGLLEQAQNAAGDHDRTKADKLLNAALEFCEYSPGSKAAVVAAYQQAHNTLEILDHYGMIDEKTGLPLPAPEAPAQAPDQSAALEN